MKRYIPLLCIFFVALMGSILIHVVRTEWYEDWITVPGLNQFAPVFIGAPLILAAFLYLRRRNI